MAPSLYLNHCWLLIGKVLWHSPQNNFTENVKATILYDEFENHILEITGTSPPLLQYCIIFNQTIKKYLFENLLKLQLLWKLLAHPRGGPDG